MPHSIWLTWQHWLLRMVKTWKQPKCSPTEEQIKKVWCVCVCVWWNTVCVLGLAAESCLTLCDPINCSPPGSPVHADSPGRNTRVGLPGPPPGDLPNPGIEPRSPTLQVDSLPSEPQGKLRNTGVGSLSFLQGIFPEYPMLLHCG